VPLHLCSGVMRVMSGDRSRITEQLFSSGAVDYLSAFTSSLHLNWGNNNSELVQLRTKMDSFTCCRIELSSAVYVYLLTADD
jgi:hypothetical protein